MSATATAPRAWPSHPASTTVRPARSHSRALRRPGPPGSRCPRSREQLVPPGDHLLAVDHRRARPGPAATRSRRRAAADPSSARAAALTAAATGCPEASSTAAEAAQQHGAAGAGRGLDPGHRHHPGGEGPGLVQHDGVDRAGGLQRLVALDEDAQLRAPPAGDHQRGRGRQPQRARAGDDQHRQRGADRRLRRAARPPATRPASAPRRPAPAGTNTPQIRSASRWTRDLSACACSTRAIRCASWVSWPVLAARTISRPLTTTVPGGDGAALGDLGGHRLPGHHAGVHGGLAELHHPVGGDRLAGPGHQPVAGPQLPRPGPAARSRQRPARWPPAPRPRPAPASRPRHRAAPGPHTTARPARTWSPTPRPPGRSRRRRRAAAAASALIPACPRSSTNIAYTDQPHAAAMPSDTSVSIDAAPCRAFFSAAAWNGHAAHPATGAASAPGPTASPGTGTPGTATAAPTGH